MRKTEAEAVLESWMKPVLGFALKRCRTAEDAEDLSQEIILKVYRTLLQRDDVEDVERYVWTVAHNALCNYYRSASRNTVGIPLEEVGEIPAALPEETDDAETVDRLKKEIAYLSETQRKIVVAYYIDRKKQEQIAREFGIPVGTVKWHLFEAKKELKRGMEKMRENGDLKYNPVKFAGYGINGSLGEKDLYSMFRSPLVQNICYSVRNTAKTVNEIADDLGVSPVYVSGETGHLAAAGMRYLQGSRGALRERALRGTDSRRGDGFPGADLRLEKGPELPAVGAGSLDRRLLRGIPAGKENPFQRSGHGPEGRRDEHLPRDRRLRRPGRL